MYDFRQTAGVFRSSAATLLMASGYKPVTARSVAGSGSGMACMIAAAPQRCAPGAEVLRREIGTHGLSRYVLTWPDSIGRQLAAVVDILKQALPRQLMALPNDLRETLVVDGDLVTGAALAAEPEDEPSIGDEPDVPVAQCRQTVAPVVARILGVPDAHSCGIEKAHHDGQNLFARQARERKIQAKPSPQPGQRFREIGHPLEFLPVAEEAPLRVIAILLAATRVAARRLDVATGIRADPDVVVRRRNREARDALDFGRLGYRSTVGELILEMLAAAKTTNPRHGIRHMDQAPRADLPAA